MTYLSKSNLTAIFDVDGTLIDSMDAWRFASKHYLASLGLSAGAVDTVKAFDSGGLRSACQEIIKIYPQLGPHDRLADAITMSMLPLYRHTLPAMPHANEFLKSLYQDGISLNVLTSNLREVIDPGLIRLEMRPFFSNILCCGEIKRAKENTSAYTYCIQHLGITPERCVMFEDQPWAAANAKAVGMRVVGVCKRAESMRWAELAEHCDLVISDYAEVLEKYSKQTAPT